jgi:hypothetical protein
MMKLLDGDSGFAYFAPHQTGFLAMFALVLIRQPLTGRV